MLLHAGHVPPSVHSSSLRKRKGDLCPVGGAVSAVPDYYGGAVASEALSRLSSYARQYPNTSDFVAGSAWRELRPAADTNWRQSVFQDRSTEVIANYMNEGFGLSNEDVIPIGH